MVINRYAYRNQAISIKRTNILIAGDSYTKRSLNPQYFTSAQNISQYGENYIITYWKLKKVFIP